MDIGYKQYRTHHLSFAFSPFPGVNAEGGLNYIAASGRLLEASGMGEEITYHSTANPAHVNGNRDESELLPWVKESLVPEKNSTN